VAGEPVYRRGAVLWRRTHDRILVLVPATREVLSLTGSGRELWAVLDEPGSLPELAERLAAIYGAPAERIATDITPVITELRRCAAVVTGTGR
jgi:hypothetical protein